MSNQLTPSESLAIIQTMVNKSRNSIKNESVFYLLWGWLVFSAAILHYLGQFVFGIQESPLVWAILMPLGGVASAIIGFKKSKSGEKNVGYPDKVISVTFLGFLGAIAFTILLGALKGWVVAYPVFMMLYGWVCIISGAVLRFKPFIFGGIAALFLAVLALFFTFDFQLLLLAAAIVVSYLIPAHMLRNQA
jgi:hypothetical protein